VQDELQRRKTQHLDLALRDEVEPEETDPLFRCVRLVHRAVPELRLSDVDLSTELSGGKLRAPVMVVGMTGGTDRAGQINRDLARAAEEEGVAFGVGSMRVLLEQPDLLPTFDVRPARPPRLFANLGAQQLVQRGRDAAHRLIDLIGADGIAVHLNPAQELVQERGDRDFTGCLDAIGRLAEELGERLIVKETGCGIGPDVVRELIARKVRVIDVSGAGGTSWTRIEQLRAQSPEASALGELLSDWGLPTAACVGAAVRVLARRRGPRVRVIASGGVRSGLDAARSLALGADVAGFALPMVRAHQRGGIDAVRAELRAAIAALRAACLLVGARDVQALRASRPVLLEPLPSWVAQLEPPP
jgi:isopentenyl-diphosphate delta-isomerase